MRIRTIVPSVLLLAVVAGLAPAQEEAEAIQQRVEQLATEVEGKDLAALQTLHDEWRRLLESANEKAGRVFRERSDASGEARSRLTDRLEELREERNEYENGLEIVLAAMEKLDGGKERAASSRAYIDAMPDYIDLKDPAALWTWFVNWLKSPNGGVKWGLNILGFLLILLIARILAGITARIVSRAVRTARLNISDLLRDFFVNAVRKVVFFVGLVIALSRIGIDIGPLLAGIGVLGFVIGFALQGTLSNFASGVMILLYRPYDIGHFVQAAGATGTVSAMSLVSTTLRTPDNQTVVIPNSSIWGGVITNVTGNDRRRVDFTFGIGYEDDIAAATTILEDIVNTHELVLKDPEPVVKLHELADSSVNFVVRPWVKTADYWTVYWDVTRAVKERFDAEGISIPYPQQDVHMHQVSGPASS